MGLQKHVPPLRQIVAAYAVIVVCIYSWTILWFFWKLSSWVYYLTAGEILTILAYALAVNFVESLLVLSALLLLALLLPRRWFLEEFQARATAAVLPWLLFMMYAAFQFVERAQFRQSHLLRLSVPVALGACSLVIAAGRIRLLNRAFEELAERATIFLYVSIPASLVAVATVIARNLA